MTARKNLVLQAFEQPRPLTWNTFLIPFLPVFLGLGAIGTGYWLWTTGQPAALCWVSLTIWLTVLVASGAILLLSLGERE